MFTVIQTELVAIFVGGLAAFLAGFIWYHPKTFGPRWMAEQPHRKAPDDFQKNMVQGLCASLIDCLLVATLVFVLASAYGIGGVILLAAAILVGSFTGNSFKGGSHTLWLIDAGFLIAQIIVISFVLAIFA